MKILIIEDEPHAAQRLQSLVKEIIPDAEILGSIDTVKRSVEWLSANHKPDLIFMDIQLADGLSFQIFDQHVIDSPVIFTTAYDEYALKAFKVNSIDYILKPVDKLELQSALNKLKKLAGNPPSNQKDVLSNISLAVEMLLKKYKTRFVVKVGEHLRTIEVTSIRYFLSQDKTTFCVTEDNRNHILDYTLEQLEDMLDPADFFRINRKYLVRSNAIQDIINYTNSRLKLILKGSQDSDIIVARERVQEFKSWLDR
ncbi:MAG TPA: LytTR family DNA-binding domain-containing protein [Chryseosolibacter sp.]